MHWWDETCPGGILGWLRHCSNHLVNTSEPGLINPSALPDTDHYKHLTRSKKPSQMFLSCFKWKPETNKLLHQQPCSSRKVRCHSRWEGPMRITQKCRCPSKLNELTHSSAGKKSGEWGGRRSQSPFWLLVPRLIYSVACKPACTDWGAQHPPMVYVWVPGKTAFGLQLWTEGLDNVMFSLSLTTLFPNALTC